MRAARRSLIQLTVASPTVAALSIDAASSNNPIAALKRDGFVVFDLEDGSGGVAGSCDRLRSSAESARLEALASGRSDRFGEIHTREQRWDVAVNLCADVEVLLRALLRHNPTTTTMSTATATAAGAGARGGADESAVVPHGALERPRRECGGTLVAALTREALLTQLSVVSSLEGAPRQLSTTSR